MIETGRQDISPAVVHRAWDAIRRHATAEEVSLLSQTRAPGLPYDPAGPARALAARQLASILDQLDPAEQEALRGELERQLVEDAAVSYGTANAADLAVMRATRERLAWAEGFAREVTPPIVPAVRDEDGVVRPVPRDESQRAREVYNSALVAGMLTWERADPEGASVLWETRAARLADIRTGMETSPPEWVLDIPADPVEAALTAATGYRRQAERESTEANARQATTGARGDERARPLEMEDPPGELPIEAPPSAQRVRERAADLRAEERRLASWERDLQVRADSVAARELAVSGSPLLGLERVSAAIDQLVADRDKLAEREREISERERELTQVALDLDVREQQVLAEAVDSGWRDAPAPELLAERDGAELDPWS